MKTVLAVLFSAALAFAQSGQIHITASPLSAADMKALFGPLAKQYGIVQVDVCSAQDKAIAVPLGLIRQQLHSKNVSILSNTVASTVIAYAQGSTKKALAGRVVLVAAASAAVASGFSGVSSLVKTALTDIAIDTPPLWNLFSGISVPAALLNYGAVSAPDPLQLAPLGCVGPYVQMIEGGPLTSIFEADVAITASKP